MKALALLAVFLALPLVALADYSWVEPTDSSGADPVAITSAGWFIWNGDSILNRGLWGEGSNDPTTYAASRLDDVRRSLAALDTVQLLTFGNSNGQMYSDSLEVIVEGAGELRPIRWLNGCTSSRTINKMHFSAAAYWGEETAGNDGAVPDSILEAAGYEQTAVDVGLLFAVEIDSLTAGWFTMPKFRDSTTVWLADVVKIIYDEYPNMKALYLAGNQWFGRNEGVSPTAYEPETGIMAELVIGNVLRAQEDNTYTLQTEAPVLLRWMDAWRDGLRATPSLGAYTWGDTSYTDDVHPDGPSRQKYAREMFGRWKDGELGGDGTWTALFGKRTLSIIIPEGSVLSSGPGRR